MRCLIHCETTVHSWRSLKVLTECFQCRCVTCAVIRTNRAKLEPRRILANQSVGLFIRTGQRFLISVKLHLTLGASAVASFSCLVRVISWIVSFAQKKQDDPRSHTN